MLFIFNSVLNVQMEVEVNETEESSQPYEERTEDENEFINSSEAFVCNSREDHKLFANETLDLGIIVNSVCYEEDFT